MTDSLTRTLKKYGAPELVNKYSAQAAGHGFRLRPGLDVRDRAGLREFRHRQHATMLTRRRCFMARNSAL